MHRPDSRTLADIPSSLFEQLVKLDAAINALDAQRQTLGDSVVDTSLTALYAKRDVLLQQASAFSPLDTVSLAAQLNRLSQSELIRLATSQPEVSYIFKHALTQQATYDSMLIAARRELHGSVARTYERLYP